jgi:inositol polyphosphate 5-phosphatase INPP5B/F
MAHFEFQELRETGDLNQKDFIFIRPQKASLGPTEEINIEFTILVGEKTIPHVCTGKPLDEIIVLEIRDGRHIFLSLQGTFQRTCFGMPLDYLASFGGQGVRNVSADARRRSGGGMPDELWRMTDFISTHGHDVGSVFLERGDAGLCRRIRDCLDTAAGFDKVEGEVGVLSMAETLRRFLEALPGGIIPSESYENVLRMGETRVSMVEVLTRAFTSVNLFLGDGFGSRCACQCSYLFIIVHTTDF